MAVILADVNLAASSGIVADDVHNTFILEGPVPVQGNTLPLTACFDSLYNREGATPINMKPASYISRSRTRAVAGCPIRYYDITAHLSGTPHGSPVAVDAITLEGSVGQPPLPDELALVVTLRAPAFEQYPVEAPDSGDPGTALDRPRARHSGRVYFGPFESNALEAAAPTWHSRPLSTLQTALLDACEAFSDELSVAGYTWQIWSRVNAATYPVYTIQVDNAWDTQRRRGPRATARTSRVIVP